MIIIVHVDCFRMSWAGSATKLQQAHQKGDDPGCDWYAQVSIKVLFP